MMSLDPRVSNYGSEAAPYRDPELICLVIADCLIHSGWSCNLYDADGIVLYVSGLVRQSQSSGPPTSPPKP